MTVALHFPLPSMNRLSQTEPAKFTIFLFLGFLQAFFFPCIFIQQNAVPTLVCHGQSFYLNFLAKKGQNSKNIAFRVMSLALQLHLVMMSKYSKFGVYTSNTVLIMGYIKVFVQDEDLSFTTARLFLRNRRAKKEN